jgi:hypothetical protein
MTENNKITERIFPKNKIIIVTMSLRFDQNGKPAALNLGLQLKNSAAQSYRVSQPKRFLYFLIHPLNILGQIL